MLHGVDISSYNPHYRPHGEVDFVIIKATEGRTYVNPHRVAQAAAARKAGCVVGFYHFLHPRRINAQAKYFVEHCHAREGDILALDWETTSKGKRASSKQKDKFLRKVKKLMPHHRVILYCDRHVWNDRRTSHYVADGLWIASYREAGDPGIDEKWLFHQYTSTPIDKNVARFGSRSALRKWAFGHDH
ncbi:glycoside hydrolase family 25 protein [Actinomadura gamaensis]|uniref:Glycoside hydrolase family 25 protein n=1 Tax=Actinomadura gamaensis TaxID=1763541 RepID=A0ABV9UA05_9ACTN